MSRPAPSQKANFLQTAILMLAIFWGMNMFLGQKNNPPVDQFAGKPLLTRADYLMALQSANKGNQFGPSEGTAQSLLPGYDRTIDADVAKKVITSQEGEAEKVAGSSLVADSLLKAGKIRDDSNKIRASYQMLASYQRKLASTPAWTQPFIVADDTFPQGHATPDQLYQEVVKTLRQRNRTDPVWGVIPGGFQFIDTLVHASGANPYFSYALAAFLLALAVRACVFKLAQKQLMFSRQMSQLTPRILEIKDKYKDEPAEQQKRTMELYKEYGINPFAGCLPALVQMPLFFFVYQCMLHYQFEFQKGYFLWINPAASKATHGFLAANLGQQDTILVVIYGITMLISSMLTPVTDPTQLKQQRMMGVGMSLVVTVFMFLGIFPVVAGFVLYWTFTNILATAQSLRAYRMPLPPLEKVNAPNGGVYPGKVKGRWVQMMEDMQRIAEEKQRGQTSANGSASNGQKGGPSNGKALPGTNGKADKNGSSGTTDGKKPSTGQQPKHKPKKRT